MQAFYSIVEIAQFFVVLSNVIEIDVTKVVLEVFSLQEIHENITFRQVRLGCLLD